MRRFFAAPRQDRIAGGHWEADQMLFSRPSEAVLVAQERASRQLIAIHHPSKAATPLSGNWSVTSPRGAS